MKNESVLLVNYDKRWGGGQEYLFTLIDGLLQNSFSVGQLMAPNSASDKRFTSKFAINPDYKNLSIARNSVVSLWKIISFARNYQILHIHREHDLWLGVLIKLFIPKIKLVFSQHIKPSKRRKSLVLFDETICNSLYVKTLFEDLYKRKSKVIFPSISIDTCAVSSCVNLNGNPILLMSAAFHKNQSEMLSIFQKVVSELPKAKLYFIGPSQKQELIDSLQKEIEDKTLANIVTILPPQDRNNYLAILKQADIVVSSYYEEAFGLAILEAMLMGKSIVIYNSGGPIEILKSYPKAFLVENHNQKEFAQAIIESFKTGNYKKDIPCGDFQSQFSEKQLVEKHLQIYQSLLAA